MKSSIFLLGDVETGGLDETKNPVTEICFQAMDNTGRVIDNYTSRIRVYNNLVIDKIAAEKTGITPSILETTGKPFKTVVEECVTFIKKHTPDHYNKPIFIAHNVLFDMFFIMDLFNRAGYNFRSLIKTVGCTMYMAKMFNNVESYNLEAVCKSEGVSINNAHSAKGDVDAMALMFGRMMQKMRNATNAPTSTTQGAPTADVTFKFNF